MVFNFRNRTILGQNGKEDKQIGKERVLLLVHHQDTSFPIKPNKVAKMSALFQDTFY